MLSGDINEPYPVEDIKNGNYTVDPRDIKSKINDLWLIKAWSWQYNTIKENVRKELSASM